MKKIWMIVCCAAAVVAAGCATFSKSDTTRMQGSWKGEVLGAEPKASCYFRIAGNRFEFNDSTTNVWYRGNFTLREKTTPRQFVATITSSSFTQYVGKTSMAIYKLDHGSLMISGSEPGDPNPPVAFDSPGAMSIEFKRP
jgi:uncharacterized protein (TIGR03067 family)